MKMNNIHISTKTARKVANFLKGRVPPPPTRSDTVFGHYGLFACSTMELLEHITSLTSRLLSYEQVLLTKGGAAVLSKTANKVSDSFKKLITIK